MALIPETSIAVAVALVEHAERTQEDHRRAHLGASELGEECLRKIWYSFRWGSKAKRDGRMVRLLRRGKIEEQLMLQDLRDCGFEVLRGEDFRISALNGHLGGTPDGLIRGIPAAPKTLHVLELKTSNDANWKKLAKHGVEEAQPAHFAQMQIYMLLNKLTRALYLVINKDDDTIYEERVELNQVKAQRLLERAERVIASQSVPERISDKPDWFQCKLCKHHEICHEEKLPDRTCRTCLHVTAELDENGGRGQWFCTKHVMPLTTDEQKAGCSDHLYLPSLVHWLQQVDATDRTVIYRSADGRRSWIDEGPFAP